MEIKMHELNPCKNCHEDVAYLETEGDWCVYVICGHCGTHTAFQRYSNEEEKKEAEKKVVELWNMGKVVIEARVE